MRSAQAALAGDLVRALQRDFADRLHALSGRFGGEPFRHADWLRDAGRHGGGERLSTSGDDVFNRASLNISAIQYDDEPSRRLSSATALSCIVHPRNPHAPSVHLHISWTELRDGSGYWRMMADLNPSTPNAAQTQRFIGALRGAAGEVYEEARAEGDLYFDIPALGRKRGVAHFYLEGYATDDFANDAALARRIAECVIAHYCELVGEAIAAHPSPSQTDRERQLGYHTLYFFQVLTLDRGTTSGLLVHDQNDVGILGSLPSHIDRALLASWNPRMQAPQDALLGEILRVLPDATPCPVDDETRKLLAQVVREHYRAHPEALALQAAGSVIPSTVANHR